MTFARFLRLAIYLVVVAGVIFAFVNEMSKVSLLKNENSMIEKRIKSLQSENEAYREEIKSLTEDRKYIEKVIREELGMIKDGEKIFRFKEEE